MKAVKLENTSKKIANAIVDLVNRTDGPVTLSRIEREVPGFASIGPSRWEYLIEQPAKEYLIWNGMSEAGQVALSKVISGRRVAIQLVNVMPYLLEDCLLNDDGWQPIVLLPAQAANLAAPSRLLRTSETARNHISARAAAEKTAGYGKLTDRPMQFSADSLCLNAC